MRRRRCLQPCVNKVAATRKQGSDSLTPVPIITKTIESSQARKVDTSMSGSSVSLTTARTSGYGEESMSAASSRSSSTSACADSSSNPSFASAADALKMSPYVSTGVSTRRMIESGEYTHPV